MRVPRALAALMFLSLLVAGLLLSLRPSPALAANTTIVVSMNSATKVFDLGPRENHSPAGWTAPNFDVSLWNHAVPVSASTAACIHNALGPLGHLPLYWGPTTSDYYLVRIPFSVPAASSYAGSSISFVNYDGSTNVLLTDSNNTGNLLANGGVPSLNAFSIGSLLRPGINVLTLWEDPHVSSCGPAVGVRISIQAQGVKGGLSAPHPAPSTGPSIALSFPANNAIVTGTRLPLTWAPFPHAGAYLVHVWLVKADPGQAITATTVGTTSITSLGTRASVSMAGMLKGVHDWDVAALNGKGALIAGWGPGRTVQLE